MNARGFRSMSVTVLLLGASIAIMAASATGFQAMRRDLTIAIVDTHNSPSREAFQLQIAALMRKAVKASFHEQTHLQLFIANTADAKAKLAHGDYDAALVLGADRPAALRHLNLVTLAGTLPRDLVNEPVSLLLKADDANTAALLRQTFSRLLTESAPNQDIHAGATGLTSLGTSVAAIDR